MDALTVDRAVPVRSTQIKREVELEIRPADTIEDYARRREGGTKEGARRERQEATASRSPLVTMTVR
jgi:hypothetical protein